MVGDTLSIKVYQALAAALALTRGRRVILSDSGNFPSDLYMAQGLAGLLGDVEVRVVAPEAVVEALTDDIAVLMLTEVDYRTGRLHEFASIDEVERGLTRLGEHKDGPYVTKLPRQSGRKEARYAHLLCGEVEGASEDALDVPSDESHARHASTPAVHEEGRSAAARSEFNAADTADADALVARVAALEAEVSALRDELAELKRELGA